jgi:LAO/AO transport system kinase
MGDLYGKLAAKIKKGQRLALAKAISLAENDPAGASKLLEQIGFPGKSFVIGITGPPGTGKSTLVDRLIESYRELGLRVGVIAVDPTSPITGGALLGDRIRMADHAGDRAVYIRSMASRGWSGGLSRAASSAIRLLDAAGFDVVMLETVGIGQSDIEVVGVAHAVLVVLMPGMGDDIQASKAGLMEVGDIYAVNKSDLEGTDAAVVSLLSVLRGGKRHPPVLRISALSGEGIGKIIAELESFRSRFSSGDQSMRLKSIKGIVLETARGEIMAKLSIRSEAMADDLARKVMQGKMSVESAASRLTG